MKRAATSWRRPWTNTKKPGNVVDSNFFPIFVSYHTRVYKQKIIHMKKIVMTFLCILLTAEAYAQSANMLAMARAELDKRGLEEGAVRARLLENGIDVDAISPTEYPAYQDRVLRILNQMQAEKAGKNASNAEATVDGTPEAPAVAPTVSSADLPQTSMGEAAAEAKLEETLQQNNVSPTAGNDIYGHSLFTGKSLDVFRTTDGAQAPDTYVLGTGDEVHISIFGSSQTEIHQIISPDGSIQPTGSTKIFLKGLTLAQARQAIKSKLAQHYSFRQDQIAVTITTARTIMVSIYGEVGVQGGFTVSALNTAFNALAAAGGPTAIGSLRNIQRSRAGKTTKMDLYQFMTGAVSGDKFDLQNNDILFVPVADKVVSIEGAVNRPMRYEMIEGETLADLIRYAGGLKDNAYPEFVQIERYVGDEKAYLEYDLKNIVSGAQKAPLEGGDIVRIKSINKPMENFVSVSGDVYYGGNFDLEKNRSLKKLLDNAKPRYTARTEYVLVERTRPDETVEVLTVPFPGINGNPDFTLQERDAVKVLTLADFRDVATISVSGLVRTPFTRNFGLNDRMSINQAIELADGLLPNVYPLGYIFRKDLTNPAKMEYIAVSLEDDGDVMLQPGDELRVYDNSTYTNMGEVHISGAVKNPFGTTFDSSITVHDLITMAGGFEVGAAPDRVEVFRLNLDDPKEAKFDLVTIEVDENYNPTEPFYLMPYDHVVVRQMPNFAMGRSVEINGRVRYPGTYVLEDSRTQLSEVIKMAGGLMDDASPYATLFRTFKGRGPIGVNLTDANRSSRKTKDDPILMEGDVINIVRMENTVTIRETGTRMAQYVPEDYVSTQKTITYRGGKNAGWYIRNYAGGFQKFADRNSVTVTMPNNQSNGTKHFLFFRIYPKVEPGSTITLAMDTKRQEKAAEPKEPVKWEQIAASSLSALTSVVSMILLIERLN